MLQLVERRLFCSSFSNHLFKPLCYLTRAAQLVKKNNHDDSNLDEHDKCDEGKCKNQLNQRNIDTEDKNHDITFDIMNERVLVNYPTASYWASCFIAYPMDAPQASSPPIPGVMRL